MLIESPEALKEWLTSVLEPLCEADPTALAKYVIALVKKDKPVNELRETCIDQLEVFLQLETKPFVECLFKALESKSYVKKSVAMGGGLSLSVSGSQPTPPGTEATTVLPTLAVSNNVSAGSLASGTITTHSSSGAGTTSTDKVTSSSAKISDRRSSRADASGESEDKDRESKRPPRRQGGGSGLDNRDRSRSRSRNRTRSRSREREDRRLNTRRGFNNMNNNNNNASNQNENDRRRRGGGGSGRRHDRYQDYRHRNRDDGGGGGSGGGGGGGGGRLEQRKRSRSRSRSPRSRSNSGSRSEDKGKDRLRSSTGNKGSSPAKAEHGESDYRYGTSASVPPGSSSDKGSLPVASTGAGRDGNAQPSDGSSYGGRSARRCRDYDEKGYCMRGDLCPYDHGNDPVVVEEVHLPTMLAYGPTGPSVPVSTVVVPRPPEPPPTGPMPPLLGPPMSVRPPMPLLRPPMSLHPPPNQRPPFMPMTEPYIPEPYNPEAPALDRPPPRIRPPFWHPQRMGPPGRGHMHGNRMMSPYPHVTRELISVPTVDNASMADSISNNDDGLSGRNRTVIPPLKRPMDDQPDVGSRVSLYTPNAEQQLQQQGGGNHGKRRMFDFNRLGARKFNSTKAVLELRKIPQGLNNIMQLNNHFSRFGKITNLQVCYSGDPEAALIQFSTNAEAHAAYRCTEAVLNNRFIKVFWHNKESEPESKEDVPVAPAANKKLSAKERLGMPLAKGDGIEGDANQDGTEKMSAIVASHGNLSKTVYNPAAMKKSNTNNSNTNAANVLQNKVQQQQQMLNAQETIKKKQEEQRKEAIKINANLQKRKQELLQKQIQQQKLLIGKIEKNKASMTPLERSQLMKTLTVLQESIEKLKSELVAAAPPPPPTSQPKTKHDTQREILDIEMELYNKQHQGGDTSELHKKVAELKQEALSLGLIHLTGAKGGRGAAGGRRGGRGATARGRGRGSQARSLDHRPKKLQVSGFEDSERDDVLIHLAQFGDPESIESEEDGLRLIVTYKTRREAEQTVSQGANFKGHPLKISWMPGPAAGAAVLLDGQEGPNDGLLGVDDLLEPELENDDLLLVDDEEEEDSEARSWRR